MIYFVMGSQCALRPPPLFFFLGGGVYTTAHCPVNVPRTALFLISLLHCSHYRDCFFSGADVNTEKQSAEVLEDTRGPAVHPLSISHCYYTSVETGR